MSLANHSGDGFENVLSLGEMHTLARTRLDSLLAEHARNHDGGGEIYKRELLRFVSVLNAVSAWSKSEYSSNAKDIFELKAESKFAFELGLREAAKVQV